MQKLSIKAKNYKCFKELAGFDVIKRINVLIGRNNSGKSSLLDLIEIVASCNYTFDKATWRENAPPEIIFEAEISKDIVTRTFPEGRSGGSINCRHSQYGQSYVGKLLSWCKRGKGQNNAEVIKCDDKGINPPLANSGDYKQILPNNMPIFIEGKSFKRVGAERNITPEQDTGSQIDVKSDGTGVTHAIQSFINKSNLPSDLVEANLLNALNEIFMHDASFTDIVCQLHENNYWEIYLEETEKGRIPLSKSGSGLKTVIMVLVFLILVPKVENKSLNHYVFAFEELENNIHPALLRRLTQFVYKMSVDNDFPVFITTHSNVLIDQFSKQSDAQIIHVTHENGCSSCKTTKTYIDNSGILDDLDVRASDLLQANGIIWVEGPSDRIYLNRWVELWSQGELKEGTHYQCIFYGGRLLSHLSADDPDLVTESIAMLNVNRNSMVLIDSDKRTRQARINDTKRRIVSEFEGRKAVAWVTKGKEIENYIPKETVDMFWGTNSAQVDPYASFFEHINHYIRNEGTKYEHKKPLLAEQLIGNMTKEALVQVLDLDEKMSLLCSEIRLWNS